MSKAKSDEKITDLEETTVDEATEVEVAPSGEEAPALVGSGEKMVRVRANVGVLGLSAGQEGNFSLHPEVQANIYVGNITVLTD